MNFKEMLKQIHDDFNSEYYNAINKRRSRNEALLKMFGLDRKVVRVVDGKVGYLDFDARFRLCFYPLKKDGKRSLYSSGVVNLDRVTENYISYNEKGAEAIAHADYYMNPLDYCDEDDLKETYGENCLEKEDEEDDGYVGLYDFKRRGSSAAYAFQRFVSNRTSHAGYGSATAACKLMELEGWRRLS